MDKDIKTRLRARTIINDNSCWIWQGSRHNSLPYGTIQYQSKFWLAHRLSYTVHRGEIPPHTIVRHACDEPACINPDHLVLGTHAENASDKIERGRHRSGKHKYSRPHGMTPHELYQWLCGHFSNDLECWEWPGVKRIRVSGKHVNLHRWIYSMHNKKNVVACEVIRHLCDNKMCINPRHLCPGTHAENAIDSRHRHRGTKLTIEAVKQIKCEISKIDQSIRGEQMKTFRTLSQKYACDWSAIRDIYRGKTWKDV